MILLFADSSAVNLVVFLVLWQIPPAVVSVGNLWILVWLPIIDPSSPSLSIRKIENQQEL